MKSFSILFSAVLVFFAVPCVAAELCEGCFVSQCREDDEGTLWCENQQVDCGYVSTECPSGLGSVDECLESREVLVSYGAEVVPEEELVAPITVIVRPDTSRAIEYSHLSRERGGGVSGQGADGGMFERNTLFDDNSDWPQRLQ